MYIKNNEEIKKELELVLGYYIRGLVVKKASKDFISEIQRMTEHTLVNYSKEDVENEKFIQLDISFEDNILIDFYFNDKSYIQISIPYTESYENNYVLGGNVLVNIFDFK